MSYIEATDIKSHIVQGVDLSDYIEECDTAIDDLAEEKGVRDPLDIAIPIHFQLKQYGINYILFRVCEDKAGVCQPDSVQFDKYFALADYYNKRVAAVKSKISIQIITGNVQAIRDRSIMSGMLFRG